MRFLVLSMLLTSLACNRTTVAIDDGGNRGGGGGGGGGGSDGGDRGSDAAAATDGAAPGDCPSAPMPFAPCPQNGLSCTWHCNVCGSSMYTTDPIVWKCLPNPSAQSQLEWTTYDEVDCYPLKGYCPGVYTDPECRIPLQC
jgi:hypothetical protein